MQEKAQRLINLIIQNYKKSQIEAEKTSTSKTPQVARRASPEQCRRRVLRTIFDLSVGLSEHSSQLLPMSSIQAGASVHPSASREPLVTASCFSEFHSQPYLADIEQSGKIVFASIFASRYLCLFCSVILCSTCIESEVRSPKKFEV